MIALPPNFYQLPARCPSLPPTLSPANFSLTSLPSLCKAFPSPPFTSGNQMATLRQGRLSSPFKLLVLVCYGTYPYVTWLSSRKVALRIGPMARLLSVTNDNFKDYLRQLETWGYLTTLRLGYGECDFYISPMPGTRLNPPPNEQELPHEPPRLTAKGSRGGTGVRGRPRTGVTNG